MTYNGSSVENGYINFHPADGKGRSVGGEIRHGKFTVKNVTPGKCRVEVVSSPQVKAADSMDVGVKEAKAKKERPKDEITANAEGNNQYHEITSGTELNLNLRQFDSTGPVRKK